MPSLYLVDGMSQVYRAFFAVPLLTTSSGFPTNALFGFSNILRKILTDDRPDYMAVCCDTAAPTFRHEAYDLYKANRSEMPEALVKQLPYIPRICEAFRISLLTLPGYEADDIVGTLARQAVSKGFDVTIVSNDKDMCQLVGEHVRLMRCERGRKYDYYDVAAVKRWMGVEPKQIIDLLSLMGDSSDNIPGVPGIGKKTAIQLLERFGNVDLLLSRLNEVDRKIAASISNHIDGVFLAQKLVTIKTDLPIEINFEQLRVTGPDYRLSLQLYTELEFKSLLKELKEAQSELPLFTVLRESSSSYCYKAVESASELEAVVNGVLSSDRCAVDVSTDEDGRLLVIAVSTAPGMAYLMDLKEYPQLSASFVNATCGLLRSSLPKYVHDAKRLIEILERQVSEPVQLKSLAEDTCIAAYLLEPGSKSYDLRQLAAVSLQQPTGELASSDLVLRVAPKLRQSLIEQGLERVYLQIELPLIEVLVEMERVGIAVDVATLETLSAELQAQLQQLTEEIYRLAGQKFNINSTKQLAEVFKSLNFEVPRKTKTGRVSTGAEVLEELALRYELPQKVLEYRELVKLKNTYVDTLPKLINARTGRLHTTFHQTATATGRLSSTDPNLQNIPIRSEIGRKIRGAFVAAKGYVLLSADYSQLELRLLAHIASDPVMKKAFLNGEDIHAQTAVEVFGARTAEEIKERRREAKHVNFGIPYGIEAYRLSQKIGTTVAVAKKFIEKYYETYSGIRRYMQEAPETARKNGCLVRSIFGRLRRLPELNSQDTRIRMRAEREAINTPIQSTAADLAKLAMIRIHNRLKQEQKSSRLLLQVHDELLFEVVPEELESMKALVKYEMENVYHLDVPLLVEVHTGTSWLDLK